MKKHLFHLFCLLIGCSFFVFPELYRNHIVFGSFFFLIGCPLIVFHKLFASACVNNQYKFWKMKYSENMLKFTELMAIFAGIAFSVFGLCMLFGIIKQGN